MQRVDSAASLDTVALPLLRATVSPHTIITAIAAAAAAAAAGTPARRSVQADDAAAQRARRPNRRSTPEPRERKTHLSIAIAASSSRRCAGAFVNTV